MLKKILTIVIFPATVIFFFFFLSYQSSIKGFESTEKVPVFIEYGTSVEGIVSLLEKKGIIENSWPMIIYLKWYGKSQNLQAGDFILQRGTSIPDLVEILSNGKATEIPVRIIEGQSIEEIDSILTKKGLIDEGEFIECTKTCIFSNYSFIPQGNLEGFLFPDTYFVSTKNFNIESFIQRLLNTFESRFLSPENIKAFQAQGRNLNEVVIMASIIEKEERYTPNMPMISGILWKRLDERIHLGVDATTRYYEKNASGILTKEDFKKDNPYNTRKYLGLPPTAIGNPGLQALLAATFPEKSKYYYYLHDNSGEIHYAITNEEHNENKWEYLR